MDQAIFLDLAYESFEVEYALAWTWRHDRDERGLQLYAELTLRLEQQHERYSNVRDGFSEEEIRTRLPLSIA